jgi:hypothetical protein
MPNTDQGVTWHFDVHTSCGEQLRFFFLGIHPTYSRADVFATLTTLCRDHEVASYGLYEIFGTTDLVFAAWIHNSKWRTFQENFKTWRDNIAPRSHVDDFFAFDAEECHYHWLWNDTDEGNHRPTPQSLAFLRQYEPASLSASNLLKQGNEHTLDDLRGQQLLKVHDGKQQQVRFFITINKPPRPIVEGNREQTIRQLIKIVQSVTGLHEAKIYDSRGGAVWLLIDASVSFEDYSSIGLLQSRINESLIRQYNARTTTYLCPDNINGIEEHDRVRFQDHVQLPPVNDGYLAALLNLDETNHLEIKGSLRLNMFLFFEREERKTDDRLENKILATIVGFLNSSGGEIIIGALESNRDQFKGTTAAAKVSELPVVGKYHLCGIDPDFLEKGGFDRFRLHLTNLMRDRIGVVSTRIEVHSLTLENKILCLIRVPKSAESQYLDRKQYFIRDGNSTREILGVELEAYVRNRTKETR